MRAERKVMSQIEESKYLATENTWRYRMIVRYLYEQYNRMKYWVDKDEIFLALKQYEDFSEYTMEQCKNDLATLTNWNNVVAIADTSNVRTVEDFKNREFRYQLTAVTVGFERMLIGMEQGAIEQRATLEARLVERFYELLSQYKEVNTWSEELVYDWWRSLNGAFRDLNRSYQDYIGEFYSPKVEELMKTTEFLIYKEGFVIYLRNFIKGLHMVRLDTQRLFAELDDEIVNEVLGKVLKYNDNIISLGEKEEQEHSLALYHGIFQSMKEWFVPLPGKSCLVEQLIESTNEIIRRITRYAAQIAERRSNNVSRKEEYYQVAALFDQCHSIEQAHQLSSMIFGVRGTMHIKVDEERETESINSSIYEETPTIVSLKPRIRTYRPKEIKSPIQDKSKDKEEKRQALIQRRLEEQESIQRFQREGRIDFAQLGILERNDRVLLLKWLTKGKGSLGNWCKTEYGQEYRVKVGIGNRVIKVRCQDGTFTMPHYILEFKEEGAGAWKS